MTTVEFPAEVSRDAARSWVSPLLTPTVETSSEYRRHITKDSPLRFALVYFPHLIKMQSRDLVSFSSLHLDMMRAAKRWIDPTCRDRVIRAAPRGAAKSVNGWIVLPAWAVAHGHRSMSLGFSYNEDMAHGQLADLRKELDTNIWLRRDFPKLRPQRGANSKSQVLTEAGSFWARGLGETALGLRAGADRPDLINLDDCEPSEANYSPAAKRKLLGKILEGVLPMGAPNCVVTMTGTVTMHGSIMHDAVRHARCGHRRGLDVPADECSCVDWILDNEFVPYWYPGVLVDPDTGAERSLWPQRWPLTATHLGEHRRGTRSFELNYMLDPQLASVEGGTFWRDEHFRYSPTFAAAEHVAYIDPAVTSAERSDQTAVAVIGVAAGRQRAVVEAAWAGRIPSAKLRERVLLLCERNPTLRTVVYESNQGGDFVRDALLVGGRIETEPYRYPEDPRYMVVGRMSNGVLLLAEHVHGSKRSRLETALDQYEQLRVWHRGELRDFQRQACDYPNVKHDDLLDGVAGGLRWAFRPVR